MHCDAAAKWGCDINLAVVPVLYSLHVNRHFVGPELPIALSLGILLLLLL